MFRQRERSKAGRRLASRCVHSQVLAILASEKNRPSVWAAEHGATSPDPDDSEGANPGVRFRIHGRTGDLPEQLDGYLDEDAPRDAEELKVHLAHATEIDLTDVWMEDRESYLELDGTVSDAGEKGQLEELVARLMRGKEIKSRLRARNP
jgi:hypothetical protein